MLFEWPHLLIFFAAADEDHKMGQSLLDYLCENCSYQRHGRREKGELPDPWRRAAMAVRGGMWRSICGGWDAAGWEVEGARELLVLLRSEE